ncbi:CGNR zinc finger domain-containing protein [Streptomyces sp. 8N616]|uniref:CGNR zinc finger domain-containing protein n=1 Tax=Streptomyces sp. 8N616 TaxID=3457414 RepID=UPI003FCF21DA
MSNSAKQESGGPAMDELPLSGEPLPLELVNTTYIKGGMRGSQVDALGSPADLDRWLALHHAQLSPPLAPLLTSAGAAGPAHLERFLELRHALRELATALVNAEEPAPEHADMVNTAARMAAGWQELDPASAFRAVCRWPEADPRLVALGEIAAEGVRLFTGTQAQRIRACPAPGCILFFVKGHARREWCAAGCGNRVRVARHTRKARHAESSEPGFAPS